jgi:hypothetical protein
MTDVNEFNRNNIEEFRSNHGRLGGPSMVLRCCFYTRPAQEVAKNGCTR